MSEMERRTAEISANGGELTRTLDALQLSGWMEDRKPNRPDLIRSAAVVDQWIASHMADHGKYGAYSYDDRAIFYRRLVGGYPMALDYLLEATSQEVASFRETVNRLYAMRQEVGAKGKVAKLIVQQDRAPMLHWMLYESTEGQRAFVRKLFKDILGFIEHQSSSSSATTASSMEEKENPISEQSGEEATSKDAAV